MSVVATLYINNYLAAESARSFTRGKHVNMPPYTLAGIPLVPTANRLAAPIAWRRANPDIVHETYFAAKPVGKGQRRILTVFDMIHELFADKFPDAKRVTAAKRAAIERADHVICISENTQRDLVRLYGTDPARTSVVHLGYSMTTEANGAKEDGEKYKPPSYMWDTEAAIKTSGRCCRLTAALLYCRNSN